MGPEVLLFQDTLGSRDHGQSSHVPGCVSLSTVSLREGVVIAVGPARQAPPCLQTFAPLLCLCHQACCPPPLGLSGSSLPSQAGRLPSRDGSTCSLRECLGSKDLRDNLIHLPSEFPGAFVTRAESRLSLAEAKITITTTTIITIIINC